MQHIFFQVLRYRDSSFLSRSPCRIFALCFLPRSHARTFTGEFGLRFECKNLGFKKKGGVHSRAETATSISDHHRLDLRAQKKKRKGEWTCHFSYKQSKEWRFRIGFIIFNILLKSNISPQVFTQNLVIYEPIRA